MLKKHIGASVLALGLLFSVGFMAAPAQASSLTSTQISAILSLLSSFGADQGTINSVSTALGGSTTTSTLSCSSFADVHYGNFDNDAGGRVSQLQTFLGIPSTAFGFGTYGHKTQAAWNSKCAGTQSTPVRSSSSFLVSATSGAMPLTVSFTYSFDVNAMGAASDQFMVNFGDGTSGVMNGAQISHTYTSAGTYTAVISMKNSVVGPYSYAPLKDSSGNVLAQTITVTGSNSTQASSATIDQSSLTSSSATPTITGTASGVSQLYVAVYKNPSDADTKVWGSANTDVNVVNSHWSVQVGAPVSSFVLVPGIYAVKVYVWPGNTLLSSGTLTVTAAQPSASAQLQGVHNTTEFGIACNGTDETSKIQTALNGLAYGGTLQFPAGTCQYSSITVPDGVTISGVNSYVTVLQTNSPTATGIVLGHATTLKNVKLASSVPRTGGAFVSTSKNGVVISDFVIEGAFVGVTVIGDSKSSLAINDVIRNGTFRSPVVGVGAGGIVWLNYSNATLQNIVMSGPTSGQQPDFGIKIMQGDTAFITSSNITLYGNALDVVPQGSNDTVVGLTISGSYFDSAGTVSGNQVASSCTITPTDGTVTNMNMSNTWCGLSAGMGMLVTTFGTGTVDGLTLSQMQFDANKDAGLKIGGKVTNWKLVNSEVAGNASNGVEVKDGVSHWSISNTRIGPASQRGQNQGCGIAVIDPSSDYYQILNNDLSGNKLAGLCDNGKGTNKTVSGNL